MKIKTLNFLFALPLFLILASCSQLPEDKETPPAVQARQAVLTETYHALIPGNTQSVYEMELTVYSNGNAEAERSIVPYNGNYDYFDYNFVGASNSNQNGSTLTVDFASAAWFIPFDGQEPPEQVFSTTGGTITVICKCSTGSGSCSSSTTISPDGTIKAECTPFDCSGDCNQKVSASAANKTGVLVAAGWATSAS